ncbi:MAG: methyltransferase domain-containing protein [Anaerolineae bacterium]|nr:methyltransferase domain-containing protein [Anaerolineae bacterium]
MARLQRFMDNGHIPWSDGYVFYKRDFIQRTLDSPDVLAAFAEGNKLPSGFGWRIDERAVEYPWVFSRLSSRGTRLLDAGSTLNQESFINRLKSQQKDITILTLAPEGKAFWKQAVSYHYGDLRELPFRDSWFDEIVCISTLEHVGMDNVNYGAESSGELGKTDYLIAARELWRVLTPGGQLLISVPYGKYTHVYWNGAVFMQQFDGQHLNTLLSCFANAAVEVTFFRYEPEGWCVSTQEVCADAAYFNTHERDTFDNDYAAAARAVACMRISKPNAP